MSKPRSMGVTRVLVTAIGFGRCTCRRDCTCRIGVSETAGARL